MWQELEKAAGRGYDLTKANPTQRNVVWHKAGMYVLAMPDAWQWEHREVGGYPMTSKLCISWCTVIEAFNSMAGRRFPPPQNFAQA